MSLTIPYDRLIKCATQEYLEQVDPTSPPSHHEVAAVLIQRTNNEIAAHNAETEAKGMYRYRPIKSLTPMQIAEAIRRIDLPTLSLLSDGTSNDPPRERLPMIAFNNSGERKGTYSPAEDRVRSLVNEYNHTAKECDVNEVIGYLRRDIKKVPTLTETRNPDLVPVGNGIYDVRTQKLLPFSSQKIFMTKTPIDYNSGAKSPTIYNSDGTSWEFDAWLDDLFEGDQQTIELLWQIMAASLRVYQNFGKAIIFQAETGANGKGTILALIRNLLGGELNTSSLSIAGFNDRFAIEELIYKMAVLGDENQVGGYIDGSTAFKSYVTHDPIRADIKYKSPVTFRPRGLTIQSFNEIPKFRDRSDSMFRRLLILPFNKTFSSIERKYIKDDYIHRNEVLEYILKRLLEMPIFDAFVEPAASKEMLDEAKQLNDPVRSFYEEFYEEFVWDLLPWNFLYDLYKAWLAYTNPSGSPVGRLPFINQSSAAFGDKRFGPTQLWKPTGRTAQRTKGRITTGEPLALEYHLSSWMGTAGMRGSSTLPTVPGKLPVSARGLVRVAPQTATGTSVQQRGDADGN